MMRNVSRSLLILLTVLWVALVPPLTQAEDQGSPPQAVPPLAGEQSRLEGGEGPKEVRLAASATGTATGSGGTAEAEGRARPPVHAQASAAAEPAEGPPGAETATRPRVGFPRVMATLSGGLPVRLRRDRRLGQGRLAPAFIDGLVTFTPGGQGPFEHGFGVGASVGVTDDGGFYAPVDAGTQWTLAPTYVATLSLSPELLTFGHVALPLAVSGDSSLGIELGATVGYRVLAGLGLFAQLSAQLFFGVAQRAYPSVAAEAGVFVDYEVLP